jgi:RNA polymerase sigma-70 factor, ECF subfamily
VTAKNVVTVRCRQTLFNVGYSVTVPAANTDEEIVGRVLDGDTRSFEIIVRRYNQRLYRATRAILRDDAEAEDAMQEAYLHAFKHLRQFKGDAKFSTWLTRIAVYEALGRLRRRKHQEEISDTMASNDDPERAAYSGELQSVIRSAVDSLPMLYRSVFVMRDVEEMSVAETAACLGVTQEAVKTRHHRARAFLRHRLERAAAVSISRAFAFLGPQCDTLTVRVMLSIEAISHGTARCH